MTPDRGDVVRIMREVAAAEIMPRFRRLGSDDIAEKKSPSDLVTIADVEAEKRLSEALRSLLPGSRVVGEEDVEKNPDALDALAGDAPVWVIDPVDGTLNYARGRACFAVIVALCRHGQTLAGWILDPVADTVIHAAAGQGAWIEEPSGPRRLHLPPARSVPRMVGSLGRRLARRVKSRRSAGLDPFDRSPARTVKYGCTGREYMDLALGALDFAQYTRLKPWDHAAGVLIHAEAGGFAAMTETRRPYRPEPKVIQGTVLLAPDTDAWDALHAVFEDAARSGAVA